nr:hypothetical protein [Tanacetum cinerariifolium]
MKKPTRACQKRMIQRDDAPRQITWTTKEEIALAKGWASVSENIKQVATSPLKTKKPTRACQKRMIQRDDAPRQIAWTTKEEIALAKVRREQNKIVRSSYDMYFTSLTKLRKKAQAKSKPRFKKEEMLIRPQ